MPISKSGGISAVKARRFLILPVFYILALSQAASAADFRVSGKVTAMPDGEACPGASYRIFLATDTVHPVVFNVTGDDGHFSQKLPDAGDYIINVEYVGLRPASRPFSISEESPTAGLGAIILNPDNETLDELVVTAKRKLVQSDGATLTYNVEDDPEASVNNTIEMLRKVPMVTVDAEENIKVNGNSNFKILVNGKEDPMLSGDVKTVLKSMPAATIKKIEVITEPGAKYDAEGTGGILNIVTFGKQSLEGFMTNYSLRLSTNNYGGSFYGRTKLDKVTASANINYSEAIDLGYVNTNTSTSENLTSDENRYQTTDSRSKYKWNYLGGNLNLSWEPDTLNLFTVQGNVGKNDFNSTNLQSMRLETIDLTERWSLKRDFSSVSNSMWLGANASFQHTFRKQGHHIVGSYIFGYSRNNYDNTTFTHDMAGISEEFPWRINSNDNYSRRHALQADYANPLSDKHLIEAGAKATWERSYQDSEPWYGTTDENMEVRESERVDMMQFQDILAAYISYSGTFGKWNAKAGLRYEHTRIGLKYYIGEYAGFTSNLSDLVPNMAVSYRLGDAANLRLAYQMRISRPGLWNLNPYRNTMTINEVSYGNPDLDSERSNNLSLTYSNYGGKLGGSLSLNYARIDNSITDYQFFEDNVLHTTYANLGHYQNAGANMNLQWSVLPSLNAGIYLSGSYIDIKADSPELTASKHGWTGNYNLDIDYTFPFMLRMSLYCGGGSGWIDLQSESSGWSYHGLSLSRSFLKENTLSVSLYGSNILTPYRHNHYTQSSETSLTTSSGRSRQWQVGGSVTFRFGSLKADVRHTDAELDMMEGSASGGGGGGGK